MKFTLNDFFQLTKIRLALSVVFSSLAGYFLAADEISIKYVLLLFFGGLSMVGASNAFNQMIEKDKDFLMKRTFSRPLPSQRMSSSQVLYIGLILSLLGVTALYMINIKTALVGAISIVLYVFAYTPLKIRTPLSVFVGAIPGAIPYMLGWVAYTNNFGIEAGILFLFQFFWQFPHFWALAWMFDDDYKKAGFKMLPTGLTDNNSAFQIVFYSIWTVFISLIPMTQYTGKLNLTFYGGILVFVCGLAMLFFAFRLMRQRTNKAAKDLMYSSIFYLTSIQIIYVLDKF